jgi:hypothetical protein
MAINHKISKQFKEQGNQQGKIYIVGTSLGAQKRHVFGPWRYPLMEPLHDHEVRKTHKIRNHMR